MDESKMSRGDLILPEIHEADWLKGAIAYEARVPTWSMWLTTKEPQKFKFDSNGCTQFSGINSVETQMNFLRPHMSDEAYAWFLDNGYIDGEGHFDFSWRYTGIKAGCSINGSAHKWFWDAVRTWGLIPRTMLTYTMAESQRHDTQESMCAEIWDKKAITPEMDALAAKSRQWLNTEYEYSWYNLNATCPREIIERELRHAPLHVGTPVCPTWNSGVVSPCGSTHPVHSTMMYDPTPVIFDHYNPYSKTFSQDYFVPVVVKGVVTLRKAPVKVERTVELSTLKRLIEILIGMGAWPYKKLGSIIRA